MIISKSEQAYAYTRLLRLRYVIIIIYNYIVNDSLQE